MSRFSSIDDYYDNLIKNSCEISSAEENRYIYILNIVVVSTRNVAINSAI